ncbi:reverse transcriptase domain-containing protein [Tanacetum coccineum]
MDMNTSIGRLCMGEQHRILLNDRIESEGNWDGPEYQDTADSGKKKEVKTFTFHRMEMEGVSKRYITPCFLNGLNAYDGETGMEYKKNMISNEFTDKLCFDYEEKDDLIDELDALLASIDVSDVPPLDMGKSSKDKKRPRKAYKMRYDGEGSSLTINRARTQDELYREEIEEDLYEKIMILNEKRPIIETLKYRNKHKKLLDRVLLDKLKLDGEFEVEEKMMGEYLIKGRDKVKLIRNKITMLDHSKEEPMGRLIGVIFQVGVTTILGSFLLLDVPVDHDVPICVKEDRVTFSTGTLIDDALSWWNAYAQPIGIEQANRITWIELKRLLTNKYFPRTKVKKMEDEFYDLTVKGYDLKTYVRSFQELAALCPNMVPNTEKLMETFIGGLPQSIE